LYVDFLYYVDMYDTIYGTHRQWTPSTIFFLIGSAVHSEVEGFDI
jgi:hypothetical protein